MIPPSRSGLTLRRNRNKPLRGRQYLTRLMRDFARDEPIGFRLRPRRNIVGGGLGARAKTDLANATINIVRDCAPRLPSCIATVRSPSGRHLPLPTPPTIDHRKRLWDRAREIATPDSGFAATSLLAGSPTSRITCSGSLAFCSFSRLALGLDLLRSFAFCLCGSLHLRDPGSFSLCLLGRFALGFSRSVAFRLLSSFTLRSLDGFEPRLLCCLALRLLRSFAPGFLRGGKPCPLGCGFATRGLSPGLFSKRVELCGPVVCLLDRSRTVGDIDLCLLCSGLEFPHLLPCRICVRTTLLRGAF